MEWLLQFKNSSLLKLVHSKWLPIWSVYQSEVFMVYLEKHTNGKFARNPIFRFVLFSNHIFTQTFTFSTEQQFLCCDVKGLVRLVISHSKLNNNMINIINATKTVFFLPHFFTEMIRWQQIKVLFGSLTTFNGI